MGAFQQLGATRWLAVQRRNPRARLRLFCFHNAGGDVTLFGGWQERLPPSVELCAVQLPGRGIRFGDPPVERMEPLVEAISAAMEPWLGEACALFGHSLGALVAFEVARRFEAAGRSVVRHLFVSSFFDPPWMPAWKPVHALPEDEFAATMRTFNGIPEVAWSQPELKALLLARLRMDFKLLDGYRYRPGPPLRCPVSAFGGLADPAVSEEHLRRWSAVSPPRFSAQLFPGDHFYLQQDPGPLLSALTRAIGEIAEEEAEDAA